MEIILKSGCRATSFDWEMRLRWALSYDINPFTGGPMGDETAINGQLLHIQVMIQHDLYGMIYSSDSVCSFFNSLFIFLQHIFCFL